jgi:hypothetical protein
MLDLSYIDIEEFNEKLDMYDGLMATKDSLDRNIKAVKDDLANVLGVNKKKVGAILKMFINLRQEGQPFDEELGEKVKELYMAHRGAE